jgi:hypothetical protein
VSNEGLKGIMKDNGILYFENTKYLVGMNKDARKEVEEKLNILAK